MDKTSRIHAADVDVTIKAVRGEDYISLTDMVRYASDRPGEVIRRWLRLSDTISRSSSHGRDYPTHPSTKPRQTRFCRNPGATCSACR